MVSAIEVLMLLWLAAIGPIAILSEPESGLQWMIVGGIVLIQMWCVTHNNEHMGERE